MIILYNEKDYYILVDGDGGSFGGGRIFEGIGEVIEQFQEWAYLDNYNDKTLKGWKLSDMIENWTFDIKKYNGTDWVGLSEKELSHKE